jgi:hypothetical protein
LSCRFSFSLVKQPDLWRFLAISFRTVVADLILRKSYTNLLNEALNQALRGDAITLYSMEIEN